MRSLALMLILAASAAAQTPVAPAPQAPPAVTIAVDGPVAPGRQARLTATATGKVRWKLVSPDADLTPFPDGKVAIFSAPAPGKYLVLAWTAVGDEPSEAAECVVTVGEVAPEREQPTQQADPPGNDPLEIVIIEESGAPFADRTAFVALRDRVNNGGKHTMGIFDKGVLGPDKKPLAALAPYVALAGGKPLPYCVIVRKADHKMVFRNPPPADAAGMAALIRKLGG